VEQWQIDLREGFRDSHNLLKFLELEGIESEIDANPMFPIRVSKSFAHRMEKGNSNDPLLRQILPLQSENNIAPGYRVDAVGDLTAKKQRGLIQKYQGRILVIMTGACAVHCRYCFRRHFPYQKESMSAKEKSEILTYIKTDHTLEEVIFSGGDPLLLTNESLQEWAEDLALIPHLKRWRIHSRLVSALPSRINSGLIKALSAFSAPQQKLIVVSHINHPNEINSEVSQAMNLIREHHITHLNQSVLLRGINDNVEILKLLSEKLFAGQVLPYYLHMLDRTLGTQHFEVDELQAVWLYKKLSSVLPGYLLPKLVREIEGQPYKIIQGH
jgi:EF-P beta-lysylation protein EpmB